jgi:hypothetical protein
MKQAASRAVFRNVGWLSPDYTASYPRRQNSTQTHRREIKLSTKWRMNKYAFTSCEVFYRMQAGWAEKWAWSLDVSDCDCLLHGQFQQSESDSDSLSPSLTEENETSLKDTHRPSFNKYRTAFQYRDGKILRYINSVVLTSFLYDYFQTPPPHPFMWRYDTKKISTLFGTWRFITLTTRTRHSIPVLWQFSPHPHNEFLQNSLYY